MIPYKEKLSWPLLGFAHKTAFCCNLHFEDSAQLFGTTKHCQEASSTVWKCQALSVHFRYC